MCGISGVFSFDDNAGQYSVFTKQAIAQLNKRGPDNLGEYNDEQVSFGHTRLSIIDPSPLGNQPFISEDGDTVVIFNGEFYNHKSFRKELQQDGYRFRSNSDTEVILHLYRKCGLNVIKFINGCFALAIWDKKKKQVLIARDRLGIKPLYYYQNQAFFAFASEMKALLQYPIERKINPESLYSYFQLNYIPDHQTMIQDIRKLEPGHYMIIHKERVTKERFYKIPNPSNQTGKPDSYEAAQTQIRKLLDSAVERRMISDVPLGAFLSGGLDSSIIVALASQHTNHLNTFSIGFKDEAFFDETSDAELIAKKFKTNHTSFSLSKSELYSNLHEVLDYIDEPFADSSALAVHILSKHTRKHVTVALSGDGADEMFSGYNKHLAHQKALEINLRNTSIKSLDGLWKKLPKSRQGNISNKIRQLARFSNGLKLSEAERYWCWCSLSDEESISKLIKLNVDKALYEKRKSELLYFVKKYPKDMHAVLLSDMRMVLCQDMLMKVDLMSMGNSLEVRTPFLDHHLVDYAFKIPFDYKMKDGIKKRILRDTFQKEIPETLLQKPKHGFEVPLLNWFRTELSTELDETVFNRNFIESQGIFHTEAVMQMKKQLYSRNPGDIHARIWAMLVFQTWYKKYLS